MIDIRQREKNEFEVGVIQKRYSFSAEEIQILMFSNSNYGYFVSSFYSEFILQDESKVMTLNHFIKCNDFIYCFIEEIIENKYDSMMWYARDYTQKLHLKVVFKKENNQYVLIDFMSNIKEIDDELSILKLIRVFGGYSEFLNRKEKRQHSYVLSLHSLIFKKFNLLIPSFDEYDEEYNEVILHTEKERLVQMDYYYDNISIQINKKT